MEYEINEEYHYFLSDIRSHDFRLGKYMDISHYEDQYGNDMIEKAMENLAEKIRKYLHENKPGKFIVSTGYCIFVMTPERAREAQIFETTIKECLVR